MTDDDTALLIAAAASVLAARHGVSTSDGGAILRARAAASDRPLHQLADALLQPSSPSCGAVPSTRSHHN